MLDVHVIDDPAAATSVLVPMRSRLLAEEPALAPLLRDIALTNRPGEYALSTLADARSLYVELDATSDENVIKGNSFTDAAVDVINDGISNCWFANTVETGTVPTGGCP